MIDEHFDRGYQSGRTALNDGLDRGIARLTHSIAVGLEALNRIEFDAPWRHKPGRKGPGHA